MKIHHTDPDCPACTFVLLFTFIRTASWLYLIRRQGFDHGFESRDGGWHDSRPESP